MKVKTMYMINITDKEWEEFKDLNARGVKVKWLIHKDIGAQRFALRYFSIEKNGYTPLHRHPQEHEVFIVQGKGLLINESQEIELEPNDAIFIPPNELHQFKNTGKEPLIFICVIGLI
ncbi:MAG: cupin domain-containing protein [Candidatus Bathyarchaeia archaeon]